MVRYLTKKLPAFYGDQSCITFPEESNTFINRTDKLTRGKDDAGTGQGSLTTSRKRRGVWDKVTQA
jgi:hypothetical protein